MTDASPFKLEMTKFKPAIDAFLSHAPGAEVAASRAALEMALIQALKAYGALATPSPQSQGADEWVLVPREPTLEMQHAYFGVIDKNRHRVEHDLRFGRYDSHREAYAAAPSALQPEASGTVEEPICPYCGTTDFVTWWDPDNIAACQAVCQGCGMRAPFADSEANALKAIIRASARPGLSEEERSNVENAEWWVRTNSGQTGLDIRRLLAIIDRLTQEPKA